MWPDVDDLHGSGPLGYLTQSDHVKFAYRLPYKLIYKAPYKTPYNTPNDIVIKLVRWHCADFNNGNRHHHIQYSSDIFYKLVCKIVRSGLPIL
jgi:hypothetical protein